VKDEVYNILLGSTILTPFQLRPDSVDSLFLCFCSDSVFVDLDISFICTFQTLHVSGHFLYVHLFTLHYVSRTRYVFTISPFLGLRSFSAVVIVFHLSYSDPHS